MTIIAPAILGIYSKNFPPLFKSLSNTFINKEVNINGTAIPNEYTNRSIIPFEMVLTPPAKIKIDANTGPKQGVQPAAKAIPIIVELNQPVIFLGAETLSLELNIFSLIIPIMLSPKITIMIPLILENMSLFLTKILPKKVAVDPIITNIIVKPSTKASVLFNANNLLLLTSSSDELPVIYIIYAGTMGSIQGDIKEINPAPKANGNETSCANIKNLPTINYI